MATASVTYTLVNGTTQDADDVMTNFNDLVTFLNNSVLHRDGALAMLGALNMGGFAITNAASLAVTGTVDGRDVSADGAKLDGIEAGATADQSAAEILTSIKTVDGSGSGLDADLLDGSHASAFATSGHSHNSTYYTESEVDSLLDQHLGYYSAHATTTPKKISIQASAPAGPATYDIWFDI